MLNKSAPGRVLAIIFSLFLAGCSREGSPVSPTPTPTPAPAPAPAPQPTVANIAGIWTGRLEMTFQGNRFSVATRAELRQADRDVTGTWNVTSAGNDIHGEASGSLTGLGVDTRFSGTVTWNSETGTGTGRCFGRATFAGPSAAPSLRWESAAFQFDNCSDPPTNLIWTMQAVASAQSPAR
jgi:hypothetical protein